MGLTILIYEDISEAFKIFDFYDEAKEFIIETVQNNPERECYISDFLGKTIYYYDKNGEGKLK